MNIAHLKPKTSEAFHIRYRNFFVGMFLLIPIILIPFLLIFSAMKSRIFEKWVTLYLVCDTNTGLERSTPVTIQGIKVGYVELVSLNHSGYVDIMLKVKKNYAHLVKKDSRARLMQKGFIGDWQIELTRGGNQTASVATGDILDPEYPVSIEQIISQVLGTVKSVDAILVDIQSGKGTVGKLIGQDSLYNDLRRALANTNNLILHTNQSVNGLDKAINTYNTLGTSSIALIDSLKSTNAALAQIMTQTSLIVENMKPIPAEVLSLMNGVQKDLRETETILKAVQKHWLLKKEVKKVVDDSLAIKK